MDKGNSVGREYSIEYLVWLDNCGLILGKDMAKEMRYKGIKDKLNIITITDK